MVDVNSLVDLTGKRAIVTGGGVGIGAGIAYRLAEAGASVLIADIAQENLDQARQKLQNFAQIHTTVVDVANPEAITRMCAEAVEKMGGVDILVNNAGIYPIKSALDFSFEELERVIHTNLLSAFMASQTVAKQMIAQASGGKIITITSVDALHPSMIGLAPYDASKHGLWGLTKNLALEFAQHNITVNAIAPGGIATPGTGSEHGETPETSNDMVARIPLMRMGQPDDIAKVALFLASDMSSYMTGSQVVVDGGLLLS